jgi:multiple sugar transport system permease protein
VTPRGARRLQTVAIHATVLICVSIVLAPVLWTLLSSLKTSSDIYSYPPRLIPEPVTLDNYARVLEEFPILTWTANSIGISVVATVGGVLVSAMAGFAFARYSFKGQNTLFGVVMVALIVPFIVMVVPLYVIFSRIDLVDSYVGVLLPQLAVPFGIFLMRQFITQAVPPELLYAARIDGASEWRIFSSIVLPLTRPAIGALGIWLFLASYNNFLWPLVILTSPDKQTLPVGLAGMASSIYVDSGAAMAGGILAAVPAAIAFLVMRRQFVANLTGGALAN